MVQKRKRLISLMIVIIYLCTAVIGITNIQAVIYPGYEFTVDGLTFSEEHSLTDKAYWSKLGDDSKNILGMQFGATQGATDTLVATATKTGRLGIVFTNNYNGSNCDLSQIKFYDNNGEEAPVVECPTEYLSQVPASFTSVSGNSTLYITGAVLREGEQFRVTLEKTAVDALIVMRMVFEDPVEYTVTLNPAVGGSYTYETDGVSHTVTTQTVVQYDNIDGIRLTSTPAEGYNFAYWEDGEENTNGSSSVEYTTAVPGNVLTPHFIASNYHPNFMVGDVPLDTWSEAFQYAASHGKNLVVALRYSGELELPSNAEPDGTYIVADGNSIKYVIPSGMKLLVPYNGAETGTFHELLETSEADTTIVGGTGQSYFAKLTIPEGVKLEVAGELNVNAQQYKNGQQNGHVAGQFGQIVVNGSLDILNNAYFYCYGYATGTGTVTAKSGATVNELLQVRDWPGGTNAFYWYMRFATKKLLAEPDGGSFIFNQYFAQNIECRFDIISGAVCKMNYTLYLTQGSAKVTICAAPELVGTNGLFNLKSGHVVRHYDSSADRMIYDIYGAIDTGNVSISLERFIGEGSMDSADFILGINNHLTLNVKNGSYLKLGSSYQLLPEFQVNVDQGGTLEVADGTTLYLWDVDDWNNGDYAFGRDAWDMVYSPSNPNLNGQSRAMTSSTCININGTLIMYNNVYTTANGGTDIGKAIQSSEGTGVIRNVEGHTVPNLRVTSGRDYGQYNGPYNAEESYIHYPVIPCQVVVGHFYEQDDNNAYAPIWTGEYHYLITTEGEGNEQHVVREGWYNRSVTVYDLDEYHNDPENAVGTIYPVGGYTFTLNMDNAGQTVFSDYEVITNNAELDEDSSFILENRDGSEKYYGSLTFDIGNEDVKIAVSKKHFNYLFAWYEQSLDESVKNVWYDVIDGDNPVSTVETKASLVPDSVITQIAESAETPKRYLIMTFNKSFGVSNFADLQYGIGLIKGTENDIDMNKVNPILNQINNAYAVYNDDNHTYMSASLNTNLYNNPYVLVPLMTNYTGVSVVWNEIYPNGTSHTTIGTNTSYTIPDGSRYIIDGTPVVHGNYLVSVDEENSTLKTIQLKSSRNTVSGDLIVDVKLKAYDYEIEYVVNNTSSTDSTKNLSENNVNWQGDYNRSLSFAKTYVLNGNDAVTGEPISLSYFDLVGYNVDNWHIYDSNKYSDSVNVPSKFAFGTVATTNNNLTATVTNDITGSSLALTNINGDETVTINMYGYHFVADRTVKDQNGDITHDIIYAMMGTKLGDTFDVGLTVSNVVYTKLDGSELIPYITPYNYETTENLQFTLIANVFQDCILSYELKTYDHMIRYGYAGSAADAGNVETFALLVKSDEEFEITIPDAHGRVIFTDYLLYSVDGNTPIIASGVATFDTSDKEVIKISGVTQDFRIIAIETNYDKKVVWKEENDILKTDYLVGSTANSVLQADDHKVFTSAVPSYLHTDGASVTLTSTVEPVRELVLNTVGTGYDVTVKVITSSYDYQINIDGGVLSHSYYINSGDTVNVTSSNLSADGKTYVITGISGADGLTVTGPANGNSQVAWGWPTATISGFTGDTNITLTLKEYFNAVLWNIDGFNPTPGSSYAIQKWSYVAVNEAAVLNVPDPYIVTAAEKGTGEELITNISTTGKTVTASISGDGNASVRVYAMQVDHVITWVVDGVSSTAYASDADEAVYLNLTGKKIVSSANAQTGNTTNVTWDGPAVILRNLDGDPTITVTTQSYDHKLTINYYDAYYNTQTGTVVEYVVGDSFVRTFTANEYKKVEFIELNAGVAQVSKTDSSFTVNNMVDNVVVNVDLLMTEEKLAVNKIVNWNGVVGTEENGIVSLNVGTQVTATIDISHSAYNVFSVEAPKACVVGYTTDGGTTYSEIKATLVGSGYVFELPDTDSEFQIAIILNGDLDKNGVVNSSDALRLNRYSVGLTTNNAKISNLGLIAADVDGNGIPNSSDALRINRYSVGLTTNNAKINWHKK